MKNQHSVHTRFTQCEKHLNVLMTLLYSMCKENGSPLSDKVREALDTKDFDTLLSIDISPHDYEKPSTYLEDVQLVAMIKKYPHWKTSINPRKAAMKAFLDAEVHCYDTNNRMRKDPLLTNEGDAIASIFRIAKRKIGSILGRCPSVRDLSFQFGPGANLNVSKYTSSYHKLTSQLDVTEQAIGPAIELFNSCPGWVKSFGICPTSETDLYDLFSLVPGSRLSFVPKTAKTDRPIGIEPLINGVIQKGYGTYIRNRLKRWGLDLRTAQFKHGLMSKQASIDELLATIDLRAASDTISYHLVMNILPYDWFCALRAVRSPTYTIQDKTYHFHKFTSMGNGYTFELESMIFYALTSAVLEYQGIREKCSVYGDDIITPTASVPLVIQTMNACGFQVNDEKSFWHGPFRESCGSDYFGGKNVRPFYLKDKLSPRQIMLLHNSWTRSGISEIYPLSLQLILKYLGKPFDKLWGPDDETDGHLIDTNWTAHKPYRSVQASINYIKGEPFGRAATAFALYRQLFTGSHSFARINKFFMPYLRVVAEEFKGHSVRNRYKYSIKTTSHDVISCYGNYG